MKTCNVCGAPALDNAAACANDGEASWSPVFDVADAPEVEPVTQQSEADPPFQMTVQTRKQKFR